MIEYKKLYVPLPEFTKFADLGNIEWELTRAKRYCISAQNMYLSAYKGSPVVDDEVLTSIDGLVIAAIIRYARCFNKAKRFGLTEENISSLPEHLLDFHKHFHTLRSKHLAHSVNVYEQPFSYIHIERENGEWLRNGAHLSHGNLMAECNANNAKALEDLINAVLLVVQKLKNEAHAAALKAFDLIPDSELSRYTRYNQKDISPKTVDTPR